MSSGAIETEETAQVGAAKSAEGAPGGDRAMPGVGPEEAVRGGPVGTPVDSDDVELDPRVYDILDANERASAFTGQDYLLTMVTLFFFPVPAAEARFRTHIKENAEALGGPEEMSTDKTDQRRFDRLRAARRTMIDDASVSSNMRTVFGLMGSFVVCLANLITFIAFLDGAFRYDQDAAAFAMIFMVIAHLAIQSAALVAHASGVRRHEAAQLSHAVLEAGLTEEKALAAVSRHQERWAALQSQIKLGAVLATALPPLALFILPRAAQMPLEQHEEHEARLTDGHG